MGLRSPLVALVLATLVVLAGLAPVGAAFTGDGSTGVSERPAPAALSSPPVRADDATLDGVVAQKGVETDNVRLVVRVSENGSARWEVQYWTRLDDDNTTAAFNSLQRDIRASPQNYSQQFAARMRSTVSSAENATGREMSASNFSVRAETRGPPQYGVVIYSFQWDGFAAVDGGTLRVGDAIEGIFLDADTRLIVEWPSGYRATTVAPSADERRDDAAVWRGGDTNFVSGEPTLVLSRNVGTGGSGAGNGGDGSGGSNQSGGGLSGIFLLVLGAVVALGVGVLGWWVLSDRDEGSTASSRRTAPNGGGPGDPPASRASADPDPRPELLSNEERVLHFVRQQGGRVKQQEVVKEFDWTEARTSQIVRQLRDDGDLEGFRLGRENVLKLPDNGPAGNRGGTDGDDASAAGTAEGDDGASGVGRGGD